MHELKIERKSYTFENPKMTISVNKNLTAIQKKMQST